MDGKLIEATSVLEDGDTTLVCADCKYIPLGSYLMLASSGDQGRISAKTDRTITVMPNDYRKWSSMPEREKVKKGELVLYQDKPFGNDQDKSIQQKATGIPG
jgi:hypothetical protein